MERASSSKKAGVSRAAETDATPSQQPSFELPRGVRQFYGLKPAAAQGAGTKPVLPTGGSALPSAAQKKMERAFDANFSSVRVHVGPEPEALGGTAFAQGEHLFFSPGAFQPDSSDGQRLLGHELAHVMQQRAGRVAPAEGSLVVNDPALEAEAEAAGQAAARGERFPLPGGHGVASGRVAQLGLMEYADVKSNANGFIWDPLRTQPTSTGKTTINDEHTAFGFGAAVKNTKSIVAAWGGAPVVATDAITGEPASIRAQLAPRVLAGAPLGHWARAGQLQAKAAAQPYLATQVIPSGLGGSDQADNVIVMPKASVEAFERKVHERLYTLVGTQNACLSYTVTITHDDDLTAGERYAKTVKCEWHEVDENGLLVSGTAAEVTFDVKSPTDYGKGQAGSSTKPANVGGQPNKAKDSRDTIQRAIGTAVQWQTEIDFKKTTADGDATGIEARKLGPDHKMGEEPKKGGIWSDRAKHLKGIAKKAYVAGHLLNHHLGGPGNDARNLAPIPGDANTKFQTEVESVVKNLVNDQHAWIYYKVDVDYANDKKAGDYPKSFTARWHQLDVYGAKVSQTTAEKKFTFQAPSKGGGYSDTTLKNKPNAATKTASTASTTVEFQHFVPDDDPGVLRPKILIMRPLVESLKQIALKGDFQEGDLTQSAEEIVAKFVPQKAELDAYKKMTDIADELGKVAKPTDIPEKHYDDVMAAVTSAKKERLDRSKLAIKGAQDFYNERYTDLRAGQLLKAVQDSAKVGQEQMKTLEDLAYHLAATGKAIYKVAASRNDDLFARANAIRAWQGKPPLDAKTQPHDDATKEIETGMGKVTKNIVDVHREPHSPMQVMTFGENEGYSKENADEMAIEVSSKMADVSAKKNKEPDYKAIPRQKLDDKLLALLKDDTHRGNLIKFGWAGAKNEVADTVLQLANMIELSKGKIDPSAVAANTIANLYRTQTKQFQLYFKAIDGKV